MISIGGPALGYRTPGGREATHSGRGFGRHIRKMRGLGAGLLLATLSTLLPSSAAAPADSVVSKSCNEILANGGDQQELLLCQLSESSTLLAQLGILVSEGLDRLMQNQGIAAAEGTELDESGVEKRKHEYLRFGKRKHEYLRFGKRKHEYLRFGKRKHEYLRFGRK
ncbi:hypothetical protein TELCIR_03690 [Teladorsagia circumcincta]|uniref:Uncharacterized protein n=1 Tax=Teladorsagia circumcincta TaxID=45464 RepID=A0A2G9UVM8_TELCI|nr:hypothetical protein TELCIR_03690 [Teladorsagia circumcincta]